jgi:hypothetical protein
LSGGGFKNIDQNGNGNGGDNFDSRPSGNGWYLDFEDQKSTESYTVYVRCCKTESVLGAVAGATCDKNTQTFTGFQNAEAGPTGGLDCQRLEYAPGPLECRTVTSASTSKGNNADAKCASNEFVTGGGFDDIDQKYGGGSGDNFHSYPVSATTWRTYFNDEIGSYTSYARCCKPPTSNNNFVRPQEKQASCPLNQVITGVGYSQGAWKYYCGTVTAPPKISCVRKTTGGGTKSKSVTATCAAGYVVTGGGFYNIDQNGGGNQHDNFASYPVNENQWYVNFNDQHSSYGFTAFAVCCKLGLWAVLVVEVYLLWKNGWPSPTPSYFLPWGARARCPPPPPSHPQ